MRNSIFKSYTKKILRSEAFISVIIVFVLAIGMIGTSYALYMDVDTVDEYQLVEVGDLKISFQDGSNIVTLDSMTPLENEDVINGNVDATTYSFSIHNVGTYDASYDIKLETTDSNKVGKEYINYIICKETCEGITTSNIKKLSDLTDSKIYSSSIKTGTETGDTYIIKVWLDSSYPGTTEQTIQLKVVVDAKNKSGKTLAEAIMDDERIIKNTTSPSFTGVETNEVGMYSAEDDYGTSWYFRGKQPYNYVNFAGFTWRIVRINGDGSIRLILDGTLDSVYRQNEDGTVSTTPAGTTSTFKSSPYNDNAYVGYMFGTAGSSDYDATHQNLNDSTVKDAVDLFYETYIESDTNNYHFKKYLSDTLFCGDKTLASTSIGSSNTGLGYGTKRTYYAATERLFYSSGTTAITTATPILECAKGANNTYSRYTANSTETTKGVDVNNDLDYPIGLLSADELVMAGAWKSTKNQSYYLDDGYVYDAPTLYTTWWTMSPNHYLGIAQPHYSYPFYGSLFDHTAYYTIGGVRPVINLRADVLIKGGKGTYESPYELKLD